MFKPLLLLPLVAASYACTGNEAREDLDAEDQTNDNSEAIIGVSPDGFPNAAHKCFGEEMNGVAVGYWSSTDRMLIIIYNDHACPGANKEQPQQVINASPRALAASSG